MGMRTRLFLWVILAGLWGDAFSQTPPGPDLESILSRYIEANGGREAIDAILSLRLAGKVFEDGQVLDLVVVKKRPNLKLLILRREGSRITLGYDGESTWRMLETGGRRQVSRVPSADAEDFESDVRFDGPLVDPLENGYEVTMQGIEFVDRLECFRLRLAKPGRPTMDLFVETRQLRELKAILWDGDPDEGKVLSTTRYSDHRRVGRIWVAHEVLRSAGSGVESRLVVDSVSLNVGMVDTLFSMPPVEEF